MGDKKKIKDNVIADFVRKQEEELDSRTPEQMEEETRGWYTDNPNNFSYWYPKVKDCGIDVPESKVIQVPGRVIQAFFEPKNPKEDAVITEWVRDTVMPEIKNLGTFLFIKNGTFSNKFDFGESCFCRNDLHELVSHITNICYMAELVGAGGLSEIVIRKFAGDLNYIEKNIPCIYHGMPLRPEFRVFYDFDKKEVLYSAFYWDYDYCHKNIEENYTDGIIYNGTVEKLESYYNAAVSSVEQMVSEKLKNTDLKGTWSVDIMYVEEEDAYYLIDMAVAETSAYWRSAEDLAKKTKESVK